MIRSLLVLSLALGACSAHAMPFHVEAAPRPALSATPQAWLQPFVDGRSQRALKRGRGRYEDVRVMAEGLSTQAKAWDGRAYKDVAFLFHRNLAVALNQSGLATADAEFPMEDEAALEQARKTGAGLLLRGRLERLDIDKRGADTLLGTNFSGTNYTFRAEAKVELVNTADGSVRLKRDWSYSRLFFDPTRLGAPESTTFPPFFVSGLDSACADLAGDPEIRSAVGLPTYTPTPTLTHTPMATPPPKGSEATPVPTATPEPTPDTGPYWVNPKTGKRVDPQWNFDPEDGTPRKDFVLRRGATPVPTPLRPTSAP